MKKLFIILSIVLLGITFSTFNGCYPYEAYSSSVREIIVFVPAEPIPEPQPPIYFPLPVPDPPIYNPPVQEQPKIIYRQDNPDRNNERQSGDRTKTRDQDGGRNQNSRRR